MQNDSVIFHMGGWLGVAIGIVAFVAATAILAHVLCKVITRLLYHSSEGQIGGSIIKNIVRVVVWVAGLALMMYFCFAFDATGLWTALGVGGIALSLGLQDTIKNLFGGLQVSFSQEVGVGDWVIIDSVEGEVKDVTWRKVLVEDVAGNLHNIPNSILQSTIITVKPDWRVYRFPLLLSRGCDLAAIEATVPGMVDAALDEAGMRCPSKNARFTVKGTELAGISCEVIAFAQHDFFEDVVAATAMTPVMPYLVENGALTSDEITE